jgi:molecular chaperone GrpE
MSEHALSSAPGEVAVDPVQTLKTDAIEAILHDFRGWLQEAAQRGAAADDHALAQECEFSWHSLVAEFTALRQEVNLQTKAARAQLEQNTQTLQQLAETADALHRASGGAGTHAEADEILRPLLKTLIDVFDALALARREVERVQKNLEASSVKASPTTQRQKWWSWWKAAPRHCESAENPNARQAGQVLNSLLVGYTMGLQRLERALAQHELEPIECVGEPFDSECMEVVDVVTDLPSIPPKSERLEGEMGWPITEVVEEVRRGYRWQGRLFRCAQVRVRKGGRHG